VRVDRWHQDGLDSGRWLGRYLRVRLTAHDGKRWEREDMLWVIAGWHGAAMQQERGGRWSSGHIECFFLRVNEWKLRESRLE